MAALTLMPEEIRAQIFDHLSNQELANFLLSSRTVYRLSIPYLERRKALWENYHILDAEGCFLECHESQMMGLDRFFMPLLLDVLKGNIDPRYVEELYCSAHGNHFSDPNDVDYDDPARGRRVQREFTELEERLLITAIEQSPWMKWKTPQEHMEDLRHDYCGTTLAILIPMLTELRVLQPPISTKQLHRVFQTISEAYTDGIMAGSGRLPLAKLKIVVIDASLSSVYRHSYLSHYEPQDVRYLVSLPSVRRVLLLDFDGRGTPWYEAESPSPISNATEVIVVSNWYTENSDCDYQTLFSWFKDPCFFCLSGYDRSFDLIVALWLIVTYDIPGGSLENGVTFHMDIRPFSPFNMEEVPTESYFDKHADMDRRMRMEAPYYLPIDADGLEGSDRKPFLDWRNMRDLGRLKKYSCSEEDAKRNALRPPWFTDPDHV